MEGEVSASSVIPPPPQRQFLRARMPDSARRKSLATTRHSSCAQDLERCPAAFRPFFFATRVACCSGRPATLPRSQSLHPQASPPLFSAEGRNARTVLRVSSVPLLLFLQTVL